MLYILIGCVKQWVWGIAQAFFFIHFIGSFKKQMCYFSSASLSCLSGIITITEIRDTVCCFLARRYNTLAMHSESPIICWYCIKQRNQSPSPWCYWTKSSPDSNSLLDFPRAFHPLPAVWVWICSCLKAMWICHHVCVCLCKGALLCLYWTAQKTPLERHVTEIFNGVSQGVKAVTPADPIWISWIAI